MAIEALINSALDRFRRCQGGIILTVLVLAFVTPSVSKCIVATDKLDRGAADTRASLPAELIRYFAGNWSGQGKFANPGKDLASDLSFVPDLGNQCIVVREKERAPNTFQFVALWSMDTVTGQLVMLLSSNHDGGARVFRSPGWHDGQVIFQSSSELRASFALERLTFERQSPSVFWTTYEMSFDGGKTWTVGDRQIFTKANP